MKKRHLFWIIPIVFIFGVLIGFKGGLETIGMMDDMMDKVYSCSSQVLEYAVYQNKDCAILIQGKMKECTEKLEFEENKPVRLLAPIQESESELNTSYKD